MQVNIKNFTIETKVPLLSIPEKILDLKLPDMLLKSMLENHLRIQYIAYFDCITDAISGLLKYPDSNDLYFETYMESSPREHILKNIMSRSDEFIWTFVKSSNTIVTPESNVLCEFILDLYFSKADIKNEIISEVLLPLKLAY